MPRAECNTASTPDESTTLLGVAGVAGGAAARAIQRVRVGQSTVRAEWDAEMENKAGDRHVQEKCLMKELSTV